MGTILLSFLGCFLLMLVAGSVEGASGTPELRGAIAFGTVGRVNYGFDVYAVALPPCLDNAKDVENRHLFEERRLTDGESVNHNGYFARHMDIDMLAFVSERGGSVKIYFQLLEHDSQPSEIEGSIVPATLTSSSSSGGRRMTREEVPERLNAIFADSGPALYDRPSFAGSRVVYVSTKDPIGVPRQSSTAVFSTDVKTGATNRLTPVGVTDYSPAASPSGEWVMAASQQGRIWDGNRHDLHTDLYAFNAVDGANRRLVVKNGGWPSWADDNTVFFHRQSEDGWWSVYKTFFSHDATANGPAEAERVTPPGVHAFTPAASTTGKWIALATRRPGSAHRHIEIFDLITKEFIKVTELLNPEGNYYNPFVSLDSKTLGYHRCRGGEATSAESSPTKPHVEHIKSVVSKDLAVIRIDGSFPSFSPDGSMIVYIDGIRGGHDGVFVMNLDGTESRKIYSKAMFGTAWDKKRKGTIYGAVGPTFASEDSTVHIVKVDNADTADVDKDAGSSSSKVLTKQGSANNAFPSSSPDGKYLVFRSGRSGFKNLYIMDAEHGEEKYLRRLTEGEWDDTMASWSPDNQWIAFSSDRANPGSGSFGLYLIHPDGTGLHKALFSPLGGRINHPNFSPDSKSVVFTADLGGQSVDPLSVPNQFQPYGEIFIASIDGTGVQRLTHNGYEDGTPSWGKTFIDRSDLSEGGNALECEFTDVNWLSDTATLRTSSASRPCGGK